MGTHATRVRSACSLSSSFRAVVSCAFSSFTFSSSYTHIFSIVNMFTTKPTYLSPPALCRLLIFTELRPASSELVDLILQLCDSACCRLLVARECVERLAFGDCKHASLGFPAVVKRIYARLSIEGRCEGEVESYSLRYSSRWSSLSARLPWLARLCASVPVVR